MLAFWVSLFRGALAVSLGVALIVQPDKIRPILGNFMGMFWLVSGIFSIRWGVRGERAKGLSLVAGVVGVLAGLAMLGRFVGARWVSEAVFLSVLGLIILLTGFMHVAGGFRSGKEEPSWYAGGRLRERLRAWPWTAVALGIFEIVLGAIVFVAPLERGPVLYFTATVWAFVGGAILIGDAIRLRRAASLERRTADDVAREHTGRGTGT